MGAGRRWIAVAVVVSGVVIVSCDDADRAQPVTIDSGSTTPVGVSTAPLTVMPMTTEGAPTVTTSSVAAAGDVVDAHCLGGPMAPPSLADGSPPGEPTTDGSVYTWGSGWAAVSQDVSVVPDLAEFDESLWADRVVRRGDWRAIPVHRPSSRTPMVELHDRARGCLFSYTFVDGIRGQDVERTLIAWVEWLGAGIAIPDGLHTELPIPVPYVASGYREVVDASPDGFTVQTAVVELAPDGTVLGEIDPADVQLHMDYPVDAGNGIRLGLGDDGGGEFCRGREVSSTNVAGGTPLETELFGRVWSIASSGNEVIVFSRDVCPEGATWGEPGTYGELLRLDLGDSSATPEVIKVIDPATEPLEYYTAVWQPVGVSADGRYVAVWQWTSAESGVFHVLDMDDGSNAGEPVVFESSCPTAGRIAGTPRFVGDQAVLARQCGNAFGLVVDVVSLADRSLVWGSIIEDGTSSSYGGSIAGLSAVEVDGEVWVIVTSGYTGNGHPYDFDESVLLNRTDQLNISRLGFDNMVFTLPDLVSVR